VSHFLDHITRLKTAIAETYDLAQIPRWITDHTYLKGEKYSFKNYEFQREILSNTARVVNVQKSSQVGLSEIQARWALGISEIFPSFSTIYTMPYSTDVKNFARTRVDPVIDNSPRLKAAMNGDLDNSEIKQIHGSFLYFKGTTGSTQAISVPADCIISDEIDRSDSDTLGQYTSRLSDSNYRLRRNFSTPTIQGHGIALEMETSKRFKRMCKCHHCAEWFLPSYDMVKIPGYDKELRMITKQNLYSTRYLEAELLCPSCGKVPDLSFENCNWVAENADTNFEAQGFYVTPFMCPRKSIVSLITDSTEYRSYGEFVNQGLGETCEQSSEALILEDLTAAKTITPLDSHVPHALGIDVGLLCHICVGRMTLEGHLLVVRREVVPVGQLEQRKNELKLQYKIMITIIDTQPFTDLVMRMQKTDKTLFGANFSIAKLSSPYEIKLFDGDIKEGKLPVHLAKISRDRNFDFLMGMFKNREVLIYRQDDDMDEQFDKHCLDIKRVQIFDSDNTLTYTWQKSKTGNDDFFFALGFLLAACKLKGAVGHNSPMLLSGVPVMRRMKTNM
jgi:hypothetical protein